MEITMGQHESYMHTHREEEHGICYHKGVESDIFHIILQLYGLARVGPK